MSEESEESEKPDTDDNLDEEPGDPEYSSSSNNQQKCTLWTRQATLTMLSLYEANLHLIKNSGNKTTAWKQISEGLKGFNIQMTENQVRWKFDRSNSKYKECLDNNRQSGRAHITFNYYDQFEEIFHKEKKVTDSHTLSSTILPKNLKKRQNRKATEIEKPTSKKNKVEASCSGVNFQEQQKSRDEKLSKYIKDKQNEIEIKKKAVEVREKEVKMKKELAAEKFRFNEKKHEDWLKIESKKYKLLAKFLKTNYDSEDSDS
ncbi:hypothetical protein PV326_006214 [Microctonus aethiopoides]|nr:hypothetical protein PV326_006214 [Microctonus aethiopoides]